MLDSKIRVRDGVKLFPFEFDVLDTPNKEIATKMVLLGMAGEKMHEGLQSKTLDPIREGIKILSSVTLPEMDATLVPPIVRDNWVDVGRMLILLAEYNQLPRPPITLTIDQYKDLRARGTQIYELASRLLAKRWREQILRWLERVSMRTLAHHLAFVLKQEFERMDCTTIAKRHVEILSLLEASGHTADGIYTETKRTDEAGYHLNRGDYKPILLPQIKSHAYFKGKK